jgi:hypothetical protein
MMEIVLGKAPAMNVLGAKKIGTYALISELLVKLFTYIRKKGSYYRPAVFPLPRNLLAAV